MKDTMNSPVAVAKQVFAAFALGDDEGLMEFVHPEGRWFFPGDDTILPWAGWWDGRDLPWFLDACKDNLDYLEYSTLETVPMDDGRVFVRARERCRSKATGKVFLNHHCGVLTVVDGLAVSWLEFADTAAMHGAFAA